VPLLHVRVLCPPELTGEVLRAFGATGGAVHLARLPGAAVGPAPDVVSCDLVRQRADDLLAHLRTLGLAERGAVVVAPVDAVMSRWAEEAQREPRYGSADAVVWEDLVVTATEFAQSSRAYLAFMAIAMMVAACGIELDNPILIVGSMVLGPDYGPLSALAVALPMGRWRLAGRALVTLLVGFAVGIALTALFGVVMRLAGLFDPGTLHRPHPDTGFIWRPDTFSFVVSWLGGAAMALSLTTSQLNALVGVVISVTTIPAAAAVALSLDDQWYAAGGGAAQQLVINLAGIAGAGALVLLALRLEYRWERRRAVRTTAASTR
jgi:uncharacterized hydrophobic protein (TIGR00271 family)